MDKKLSQQDLENVNGGFNGQTIGDIDGKLRHGGGSTFDGSGKEVPLPIDDLNNVSGGTRRGNKEDELFIPPATE